MRLDNFNQTSLNAFKRQNSLRLSYLPSVQQSKYKDSLINTSNIIFLCTWHTTKAFPSTFREHISILMLIYFSKYFSLRQYICAFEKTNHENSFDYLLWLDIHSHYPLRSGSNCRC